MLLHPDKFGFYEVNEYRTYSKIEAIEYATKNKKNKLVDKIATRLNKEYVKEENTGSSTSQ